METAVSIVEPAKREMIVRQSIRKLVRVGIARGMNWTRISRRARKLMIIADADIPPES